MNRVFGKKKQTGKPVELGDVSGSLGTRIAELDVKIGSLDKELRGYREKLRTTRNAATKKMLQKRAMDVLKRKRMYETQRDQVCSQQFNIDQAKFGMESAKASIGTVAAMKSASEQMKQTIKNDLHIDEIDDITEDLAEMMDEFNELNEALGRNFNTPEELDEADLEAELEMLEDELFDEEEELKAASTELQSETATPSYIQESNLPVEPSAAPGNKNNTASTKVDEHGLPIA